MASGALFGSNVETRSQSRNLVEFKAGKMHLRGARVHPDKRKGLVYLYQSNDSLMHFCWKDRTNGTVEDDFIIFPDDVEFSHVPQCTTGRVYVLKFKSNNRNMFFWMQEPKADKDEDLMKKVNENLNNPPIPGSSSRSGGSGRNLPADIASLGGDSDLQSLLGNMNQQQLMQLLGRMGMGGLEGSSALMGDHPGSTSLETSALPSRVQSSPGPRNSSSSVSNTPSSTQPRPVTAAAMPSTSAPAPANPTPPPAAAGGRPTIQLSDLQNILSGMGPVGAPTPSGASGGGAAGSTGSGEAIDLSSSLTAEAMLPILANADVQNKLLPHLPEGETLPRTVAELRNTVSTPQFQQALQSFSAALASGQLGLLMQQFELGDDVTAAATAGDVEGFVKAMQAREKKDEREKEEKE